MTDLPLARFRATLHYDGTDFHGWQLQPEGRTVQAVVEDALAKLVSQQTRVLAAGRTDTGVHAAGQEISFQAPDSWAPVELRKSINALLPSDVWVERLDLTDDGFHPRFDAIARRYEYLIADDPGSTSPLLRNRAWIMESASRSSLDEGLLAEISGRVCGERSFSAFSKSGQPERGTRCDVQTAAWTRTPSGLLHFTIVADRFLHRMVRYLVATLVEVSSDRRERAELDRLLEGDVKRARPPVPAPACGLYLTGVRYPDGWNRPTGIPGLVASAELADSPLGWTE